MPKQNTQSRPESLVEITNVFHRQDKRLGNASRAEIHSIFRPGEIVHLDTDVEIVEVLHGKKRRDPIYLKGIASVGCQRIEIIFPIVTVLRRVEEKPWMVIY